MKKFLILISLAFSFTACAFTGTEEEAEKKGGVVVEVTIQKFKFIPETVTIQKGQTIRWINKEKRQYHSVWFKKDGEAESDYLFPDDTLEKSFGKTGEFDYICGPHPEMIGKIIVK